MRSKNPEIINMHENLTFKLIPRNERSDFDWMNIDLGTARAGKVRGLIDGKTLTINSINICSKFEGHDYARKTIDMFKKSSNVIIANRVRYSAIGFWQKMGFNNDGDGNYIWKRKANITE